MVAIDRNRVKRSFDSHACEYDSYAVVQKRVVNRFLELYRDASGNPMRILDIGAGTGHLLHALAGRFPSAQLVGLDLAPGMCHATRSRLAQSGRCVVCSGDAESLPFADNSFDLVVSTSTLQWLEDLDRVYAEVRRVLSPGGSFCFAMFGEATLHELRDSYRQAWLDIGQVVERRTHSFADPGEVAEILRRSGFFHEQLRSEMEIEQYQDVPALLRNLRRIGAGNASREYPVGLSERRVMLAMMEIYRNNYSNLAGIPATYQVIYGIGRKPAL